ncbi:hypothetical protein [Streptomyces bobili]
MNQAGKKVFDKPLPNGSLWTYSQLADVLSRVSDRAVVTRDGPTPF